MGTLVIGTITLHAPKSCVSTFLCQIAFVIGTGTSRYEHTKKPFCACNELWRHNISWCDTLLGENNYFARWCRTWFDRVLVWWGLGPIQYNVLYGENAYTRNMPVWWKMHEWWSVPIRWRCLHDRRWLHGGCTCTINMMRVRVFTSLFHIWYARGYSSICFVVTRVPWTYLS